MGDLFKEHGSLMCKWDVVYILTVKGNLRHRIDKLGEEVAEIALQSTDGCPLTFAQKAALFKYMLI